MTNFTSRATGPLCALVLLCAAILPAAAANFDSMVLLSRLDDYSAYNDVWGFVGNDGREYMIQGLTTGTAWWDIEDPVHPVFVRMIGGPSSTWRDMFVIGDHCYISTEGGGGIQIVDISDPTNPTLVNTYTDTVGSLHNIFGDPARNLIFGIGGYSNGANGGIQIFDVTDPVNIVEISQWNNRYLHDISLEGNIVHACLIYEGKLRLIDISDSTNPVNLGSAFNDPTGAVHASWPVGDGVHVLIAEETTGGHVKALDVSNPSAITQVGVHNPAPSASIHNIHVEGDLAYAAWYARGVRVLDVSDPSNLTEVGYWDTFPETDAGGVGPGNWGVYPHLPSGVIAANDRTYGMFLLRYDPTAGVMDGTVSSSDGGPAPGATVEFAELNFTDTTDATGTYTISSFAGAGKQLVFGGFGFSPDTMVVTVPPGGTVTTDVTLVKLPWGGVSGRVTNAGTGLGIEAAEVSLLGTPLLTETDAAGDYSFPDVPEGAYAVEARRYGFVPSTGLSTTIVAGSVASLDATLEPAPVFEDFSVASGWTVQNDAATTTGFWVFEEPFGTYQSGVPFQTETDHTLDPENKCAVTGNEATGSLGADDVDGGATKLLSPAYDLSAMTEPHVFYYRWYAVNAEEDEWTVELTLDGGASWALLESTPLMEAYWKPVDIDLTAFVSGPGAGSVQFRFTALDPDPGQLVEAALDDFTIYDASSSTGIPDLPPAPAMVPGLAQNAPNPFADETTVRFSVAREGPVELSVFDVRGARVAVLADGDFAAGSHEASWDGRSTGGRRAASGVYYYRLTTPGFVTTKSLVLLK